MMNGKLQGHCSFIIFLWGRYVETRNFTVRYHFSEVKFDFEVSKVDRICLAFLLKVTLKGFVKNGIFSFG